MLLLGSPSMALLDIEQLFPVDPVPGPHLAVRSDDLSSSVPK